MTSNPTRGLNPLDTDDVVRAVSVLREHGFAVDGVDGVEHVDAGVRFDLALYSSSRVGDLDGGDDLSDRAGCPTHPDAESAPSTFGVCGECTSPLRIVKETAKSVALECTVPSCPNSGPGREIFSVKGWSE